MIKIDGKKIAEDVLRRVAEKTTAQQNGKLVIILVGDDPASRIFTEKKVLIAKELMIPSELLVMPKSVSEEELIKKVKCLGEDGAVSSIIVQLPLPEGISKENVIASIPANKDIDNLKGGSVVLEPAVEVLREIVGIYNLQLPDLKVSIVGRGMLIGRPIFNYLKDKVKSIDLIGKDDDRESIKTADLIVTGVGKNGVLKTSELKEGAVVIDFGTSMSEKGKLVGDLLIDREIEGLYTPTPGGTGPILIAKLFENYLKLSI